jgi:hypothetical protein
LAGDQKYATWKTIQFFWRETQPPGPRGEVMVTMTMTDNMQNGYLRLP